MGLPSKVPLIFMGETARVKLLTAVDNDDSGLHMVCQGSEDEPHPPARVKMPATCTSCGKEGTRYSFKDRGRETPDGLVVVTDEELRVAAGAPVTEMVVTAHPLKDVLENTFPGKTYLLVPSDAESVEVYSMIRQALDDNPGVALVTTYAVSSTGPTRMWRLGVNGDAISATELAWPEAVRARPAVPRVQVVDELRGLANEWLALNTEPFDPTAYRNTARAAREALIASKAGTAVPLQPLPGKVPANVSTSLMDRLKASVEQAKAKQPAKKPVAKKAAAKKTAAKKSA